MADNITITLSNNGLDLPTSVPAGADLGHVRTITQALEAIGAPSSYDFAVNAVGQAETYILQEGDKVTFRPKSGEKGAQ